MIVKNTFPMDIGLIPLKQKRSHPTPPAKPASAKPASAKPASAKRGGGRPERRSSSSQKQAAAVPLPPAPPSGNPRPKKMPANGDGGIAEQGETYKPQLGDVVYVVGDSCLSPVEVLEGTANGWWKVGIPGADGCAAVICGRYRAASLTKVQSLEHAFSASTERTAEEVARGPTPASTARGSSA